MVKKSKRSVLFKLNYKWERLKNKFFSKYMLFRYCYLFEKGSSKNVIIKRKVKFNPYNFDTLRINLADEVFIERHAVINGKGKVHIGRCTTIGEFTIIGCNESIYIGDYVQIASGCSIRDSDHVIPKNKNELITTSGIITKSIVIEDDVWVASNVTILKGVTIGKGSVVAAGAVVTKDVPPYSIVGGVPAKVIKKRG